MSVSKLIRAQVTAPRSTTIPCIWSNCSVDESHCVFTHARDEAAQYDSAAQIVTGCAA